LNPARWAVEKWAVEKWAVEKWAVEKWAVEKSVRRSFPMNCCRTDHRSTWVGFSLLIGIALLGAGLRGIQVGESLWLDELHTSWVVADGFSEVFERAWLGNQSAGYFMLTWLSIQLFGSHEWVLRLPSLLAGTALIALAGGVVWRWTQELGVGLLTALIVAVNRDCIFYAQEARPYALLQVGALLHGALFAEMLTRPTRWRRVAFVVGGAALFFVHYTIFLFFLAELVCWMGWRWKEGSQAGGYGARHCLVDGLGLTLLTLPAIPHLREIASRRDAWARLADLWPSPALWHNAVILVGIPVLGWICSGLVDRRRMNDLPTGLQFFWTGCWFVVPLSLAWLSTYGELAALWMIRYLVAALVGMLLFCGLLLAAVRAPRLRLIVGSGVVAASILTSGMVEQYRCDGRLLGDRQEDWRGAIDWLNTESHPTELPVLLMPGLLEDAMLRRNVDDVWREYCCFPVRGLYPFQGDIVEPLPTTSRRPVPESARDLMRQAGGAWLVVRTRPSRVGRYLEMLERSFDDTLDVVQLVRMRSFGNLVVAQLRLTRPSEQLG
jgi:mannosyltransferase